MLLTSSNLTIRYGVELLRDRTEMADAGAFLGLTRPTLLYLARYRRSSTAGTALLCRQIYDIACARCDADPAVRRQAGGVGGLLLILTDIVDDQVDRPSWALAERDRYLEDGLALLLHGTVPTLQPMNEHQVVSHSLAQALHRGLLCDDDRALFPPILTGLVANVREQIDSRDLSYQLALVGRVAGTCGRLVAAVVEHFTHEDHLAVRRAATCIGAYAGYLDHAYELSRDVQAGVLTYAPLYLLQNGDTRMNRHRARQNLLDAAELAYKAGLDSLDHRQIAIYRAVCHMLAIRYRFIEHLRASLKF